MKLEKYDNKCIRLEDKFGDIYEGLCMFNNKEYNEHEYGVSEDSLVMSYTIFYKSMIKKIKIIDTFSEKYGKLEELVMKSGLDIVEEVLDSEDDISIYRLLLCLEDNISKITKKEELSKQLENLINYNKDEKIIESAKKLLEKLKWKEK